MDSVAFLTCPGLFLCLSFAPELARSARPRALIPRPIVLFGRRWAFALESIILTLAYVSFRAETVAINKDFGYLLDNSRLGFICNEYMDFNGCQPTLTHEYSFLFSVSLDLQNSYY